ncbi:hypothetical protein BD770DRAFT_403097 [Pilaira anomala]|nr:hypothetical protein BD770DRAFT_403097 [Pilaira anomala]
MNLLLAPPTNLNRKVRKSNKLCFFLLNYFDVILGAIVTTQASNQFLPRSRLIIYSSNPKKDSVFDFVEINPKSVLFKIYSVSGDGNCGFRAVSLSVYHHQENWINVKQDMLSTYQKYQDSLYKPVVSTQTMVDFEQTKMLKKLASTISPCYNSKLWFITFSCPQVVADTYNRPVVIFTYREFYLKDALSFLPLVEMNIIENINNPILLLLAHSHFYLIELKKTPKGKLKKYEQIPLNPNHQRIRETYPQQCNSVDFFIIW